MRVRRPIPTGSSSLPSDDPSEYFYSRYKRAYTVARVLTASGSAAESIGRTVAGIVFVASMLALLAFGGNLFTAGLLVTGVTVGGFAYLLGFAASTTLKTLGQILLATLDTAVNSCGFLGDAQKCEVMGMNPAITRKRKGPPPPLVNESTRSDEPNARDKTDPDPKLEAAKKAISELRTRVDSLLANGKVQEAAKVRARMTEVEKRVSAYQAEHTKG